MKQKQIKKVYIQKTKLNELIRAPKVRTISSSGEQLGILLIEEALKIAQAEELDLVEVSPDSDPPVCRIMDHGKFLYEKRKKTKKSKTKTSTLKEIKLRPKIGLHDFEFKSRHVERFIADGDKVKATIMFRGREMDFTEKGREVLLKLAEAHKETTVVEKMPKLEGRTMTMILSPIKK